MARNPTPLRKYLLSHAPLKQRLADIRAQSAVMEDVGKRLPPTLRRHCVGARRDGETLILFVKSGVWATRLRYELNRIMPETSYRNFRVRVAPQDSPPSAPEIRPKTIPSSAAHALNETASGLADQELSAVLRRLASHRRKDS